MSISKHTNLHVVVGLGKTGLSCVRYLKQQGLTVAVTDTRETPPDLPNLQSEFPDVMCSLGKLDESLLLKATQIIASPGISLKEPALIAAAKQHIPIIGDIELFAQAVKTPVIAITGTNGKSTVTTLVGEMAAQAGKRVIVGGNIGTPVLDLLAQPTPDLYVLELSSFQLETTESLLPRAATILNVTPDHMDRYDDLNAYCAAKQRIYKNCAVAIWNRDDMNTKSHHETECITFGADEPSDGVFGLRQTQGVTYLAFGQQNLLSVDHIKLQGQHNWINALSALALGHAIELPMSSMLNTLRTFGGLTHRCQRVRELNGVAWYNDSKATNVGASCAAITGISNQIRGEIILIAGGLGKGADFSALALAVKNKVRAVLLLGEAAPHLQTVLSNVVEVHLVKTLNDAVQQAHQLARAGDAVLLAPACASWDMFKDFNHRGEVFIAAVEQLA